MTCYVLMRKKDMVRKRPRMFAELANGGFGLDGDFKYGFFEIQRESILYPEQPGYVFSDKMTSTIKDLYDPNASTPGPDEKRPKATSNGPGKFDFDEGSVVEYNGIDDDSHTGDGEEWLDED